MNSEIESKFKDLNFRVGSSFEDCKKLMRFCRDLQQKLEVQEAKFDRLLEHFKLVQKYTPEKMEYVVKGGPECLIEC